MDAPLPVINLQTIADEACAESRRDRMYKWATGFLQPDRPNQLAALTWEPNRDGSDSMCADAVRGHYLLTASNGYYTLSFRGFDGSQCILASDIDFDNARSIAQLDFEASVVTEAAHLHRGTAKP